MTGTLSDALKDIIRTNGPMTLASWMGHCLGHPEHGYYVTRDPFGASGDFITAPEVSQMFGEIIGAWVIDLWQQAGCPQPVNLVELGPGRGTLMSDILRVVRLKPNFCSELSVHLVETSPVLAKAQETALASFAGRKEWHESLQTLPQGPLFVVANEFFDALPIRQFVFRRGSWEERMLGLDADGELTFGFGPGRPENVPFEPQDGDVWEERPAAAPIVAELAERFASDGGGALIIDYGHGEPGFGDTLQAVARHEFADPLKRPGEVDLTAHVDFAALSDAAFAAGADVYGPMHQGEFLLHLGLVERAGRLGFGRSEEEQEALRNEVTRLAGPEEMGELFKVLAIVKPGLVPAPFANS
ncbi:class I SAM-dependent methyltransferase [Afifella aestuarii]|uniref:class I SAM-dependent methyltransferase n=1 Tax=Afifella aestuarii TaxID=1909496 RepID=UPI00196B244F|nr:class I SAM-dependent methyltransferase [Afifella aestuarii]